MCRRKSFFFFYPYLYAIVHFIIIFQDAEEDICHMDELDSCIPIEGRNRTREWRGRLNTKEPTLFIYADNKSGSNSGKARCVYPTFPKRVERNVHIRVCKCAYFLPPLFFFLTHILLLSFFIDMVLFFFAETAIPVAPSFTLLAAATITAATAAATTAVRERSYHRTYTVFPNRFPT